jgi:hypothetical protein
MRGAFARLVRQRSPRTLHSYRWRRGRDHCSCERLPVKKLQVS